tara:strand:- start:1309 stop:1617 length:309 start_codon:yes stop_codon:yes gene_type:complete
MVVERYNAILAAWVKNGETLPEGFTPGSLAFKKLQAKLALITIEPNGGITIAELLTTTMAEVGSGKTIVNYKTIHDGTVHGSLLSYWSHTLLCRLLNSAHVC